MPHSLPTQDEVRDNPGRLLRILAEQILAFREQHLHEGSDYHDAITNGQKPLAVVSQCVDSRQPAHTILGLPLGKLLAPVSIAGFLYDYPRSHSDWASILFGVRELGAPVIIKLGHTGCGGADKLIKHCWGKTRDELLMPDGAVRCGGATDPIFEWLKAAVPLTVSVMEKNPNLAINAMTRALEEELVRDGVGKLERFFNATIQDKQQRPAVVGLLFEMGEAKLHHLVDGEFKLLSETQAQHELDLAPIASSCCRPDGGANRFICDVVPGSVKRLG